MSTAPKGYPSTQKLDRITADYASVTPVSDSQNGLAVNASIYVYQVALDSVDAGTTASQIKAAGIEGVARKGDIIRFTAGNLAGLEFVVDSVSTDIVTLVQDMSPAPATNDTFAILRFIHPVASSSGGVSAAFTFTRNGAAQVVVEDTVTPANDRPLPVKFVATQSVQTLHNGANASSVKIGDGTTLVGVTTDNELKVSVTDQQGMVQASPMAFNDHSVTPVTTAAYVEVVALVATAVTKIQIFDSSGETLILALGAAGFETDLMYIFPGGIEHNVYIPVGQRLSIKAKSGNATSGYFAMNLWSY